MVEEEKYWVGFNAFPGIGPVRFKALLNRFGSARSAWNATLSDLSQIIGFKISSDFISFKSGFDPASYYNLILSKNINIITIQNSLYPELLKEISDPPFVLYVKTNQLDKFKNLTPAIAVVGTRKMTSYGKQVTQTLVHELVNSGLTIVSGLAYGVDAEAHETAIGSGGKTIAVLGCGVDIIAPPSNYKLYNDISRNGFGAVISEMPLGLRPNKGLFPARNRIISGLSLGTVVIEGDEKSGALITARNAADQGREVFAVPGSINSRYSRGPFQLIKKGAKLVENVNDILDELGLKHKKTQFDFNNIKLSGDERQIIDLLTTNNLQIDEIIRFSRFSASKVLSVLTMLEMRGLIKDIGDKTFSLNT